jgi:hypothetical protein
VIVFVIGAMGGADEAVAVTAAILLGSFGWMAAAVEGGYLVGRFAAWLAGMRTTPKA